MIATYTATAPDPVSAPATRKWISTCGHSKRIQIGSMEYEDADTNGWSYCPKNGCKDTISGQWADCTERDIVNGKNTPTRKAASKATPTRKPAAKPAASKARKAMPNNVRALREQAEQSTKELAATLGTGWTPSTVRRIERGARQATLQQVAQLAAALGVPAADLGIENAVAPASKPSKAAVKAAATQAAGKRQARKNTRAAAVARDSKAQPTAARPSKVTGKVVGKRTGKVLATKADVVDELHAILGA